MTTTVKLTVNPKNSHRWRDATRPYCGVGLAQYE